MNVKGKDLTPVQTPVHDTRPTVTITENPSAPISTFTQLPIYR